MTHWARPALQSWASARGLRFQERGLLPPHTALLRESAGAGSHLAGIVREEGHGLIRTTGGFTRRPERYTENLCSGLLPGGIEGVVAHHMYLAYHYLSSNSDSWTAVPHTVVFTYLPQAAQVGDEVDLSQVAAAAPPGTQVELEEGYLCVWRHGVLEDEGALDALCHVAAGVAEAARTAAARQRPLDPAGPIGPPAITTQSEWIAQGAASIPWTGPPSSVPLAIAAYRGTMDERGESTRRKTTSFVLIAGLLATLLFLAVEAALLLGFHLYIEAAAAALGAVIAVPRIVKAAISTGRETEDDEVGAPSRAWGLDAFASEYARARGMALEDPAEFRRRFASPIPGAPLKVLYGPAGRLVLWQARTDDGGIQYWNLAVVPAPPGTAEPHELPGYRVARVGDAIAVAEQVPDEARSVERLDALMAAARQVAGPAASASVAGRA
jgi:hypothetical protein